METNDELVQALADAIEVPATSPYDDVTRGRSRLARRRAGVAGAGVASLAVAAVIGGVALLGNDGGGHAGDRSVAAGPSVSQTALTGDDALATVGARQDDDATVRLWRDVLAEHLDPTGTHLEKKPSNMQSGGAEDGGAYLGTKLGWSNPGEPGLGMVQIGVASSRAALEGWWDCDTHAPRSSADCAAKTDAGSGTVYYLGTEGRTTQLVVVQAPDRWVFLNVDPLFGNNSEVSVDDLKGLELDKLLKAALDRRLQLPRP